jgi:hypothetical protein
VSFASLLDHEVAIYRAVETGALDDFGHDVTALEVGQQFAAAIQPKSVREVAAITDAGASIGEWTIFCLPRVVTASDAIVHDTALCPKPDAEDLPTARFEITGVRNAAGRGHHLEIDARLAGEEAGVEGS